MFRKLVSLDEAKNRVEELFSPKPLGVEEVPLKKAVGRVIGMDVVSPIDVPPFNRSTVDGYAVKSEETFGAEENRPRKLKLAGRVDIGYVSKSAVQNGTTVEIVTGAPLPIGTDAVIMVENTSGKDRKILVYKPVAKSENVMKKGSDIRKGELVLRCGRIIGSRELGVLAALGFMHVKVFRQPRVAIISTGAEIVAPGEPLPPGKIYDINSYTLTAAVLESGAEPIDFGIVQDDDVESLRIALKEALTTADLVITSGGVSVGPKDVVPKIVEELGKPGLVVHGVAVKPGKPVAVAIVKDKPAFLLPGHPTSSLLMFYLFVQPFLCRMSGREEKPRDFVGAIITEKLFSARGRRTFATVTLSHDKKGQWLASPIPTGQSGAITTLAKADGYVELKENQQFVEAGEEVTVFLFKNIAC